MKPSQSRIDRSVRYMKRFLASDDGQRFEDEVGYDARFVYIIGTLICTDAGVIPEAKLESACEDADVRYAAMLVAGRLGWFGPTATPDRYA